MKLTKKQLILIDFIQDYTRENQISPSYREIMCAMGLSSVSAVSEHIENLVALGALRKVPNAPRSLEIVDKSSSSEIGKIISEKIIELESAGDRSNADLLRQAAKLLNVII